MILFLSKIITNYLYFIFQIWDDDLANNAIWWANQCPFGHSGTDGMGENIYWYMTSGDLDTDTISSTFRNEATEAWYKPLFVY